MKKTALFFISLFLMSTFCFTPSHANYRTLKPVGVFATIFRGPSFMGNIGWNAADFARLHVGYGSSTFDLGAKFLIPQWNFSPFFGVDYFTNGSASGGASPSVGIDLQTIEGLNIGAILYFGSMSSLALYFGIYF